MITYNEIWNGWQESNYDSRYQTLTKRIGRIVHSLKVTRVIMQKRRSVYENKVYFSVIKILNINGFWLWFSRVAHSRPGLSWLEGCQGAIWSRNRKWTVFRNVCSRSRSRRCYVTLPTKRIKAFLGSAIFIYKPIIKIAPIWFLYYEISESDRAIYHSSRVTDFRVKV